MTLKSLIHGTGKLVQDNSPAILTGLGMVGAVSSVYLTGKATFKAAEILSKEDPSKRNLKSDAKAVWKLYIPAGSTLLVTLGSVFAANRIGSRRTAALAMVYGLSEKAFDEYKTKMIEKLGEHKEQTARDEIAQERLNNDPLSSKEVLITGNGDVLFYDAITGRYFNSNMEAVRKAQNDLNYIILNDMYASLGDFYGMIGLPRTPYSEEVGWNADRMLEIDFSTVLSEDGKPCISIDYRVTPIREYHRLR